MALTRRKFIQASSLGLTAGSALLDGLANAAEPKRTPASGNKKTGMGTIYVPSSQSLRALNGGRFRADETDLVAYDLDRDDQFNIRIPLGLGHGMAMGPASAKRAAIFEIFGNYACEIDLNTREAGPRFQAKKGWVFSGHGTYSLDGKLLLTPEYPSDHPEKGRVMVREAGTAKVIHEMEPYNIRPHDITWADSAGKIMVLSHYGRFPEVNPTDLGAGVVFVEFETGKLLKTVFPQDRNELPCHLGRISDDKIFILSINAVERPEKELDPFRKIRKHPEQLREIGYRNGLTGSELPGFLMTTGLNSETRTLKPEKHQSGFVGSIGIAYHEATQTAAITHTSDRRITFWDVNSETIKAEHVVPNHYPAGIVVSADGKYYLTLDDLGRLHFFETSTLKLVRNVQLGSVAASGSAHIYLSKA